MSMGFAGGYADVIEFEAVQELCPAQAAALEETLARYGVELEAFAQSFQWQEPDLEILGDAVADRAPEDLDNDAYARYENEAVAAITQSYEDLKAAFARATLVGEDHLDLFVGHHSAQEEGDRYDEVDGSFWAVVGLYQLGPAGRKFGGRVERRSFVTFG